MARNLAPKHDMSHLWETIITYRINQTEAGEVLFLCSGNNCLSLCWSIEILSSQKKEQMYTILLSLLSGMWYVALSVDTIIIK